MVVLLGWKMGEKWMADEIELEGIIWKIKEIHDVLHEVRGTGIHTVHTGRSDIELLRTWLVRLIGL